jgi:hypothetical protein
VVRGTPSIRWGRESVACLGGERDADSRRFITRVRTVDADGVAGRRTARFCVLYRDRAVHCELDGVAPPRWRREQMEMTY